MNILSRALRRPDNPPPSDKKRINLALQGGGAHGAFTWGVLDELLNDSRIEIEGISGTSAGAINAVMVADGLARGGPEEVKGREVGQLEALVEDERRLDAAVGEKEPAFQLRQRAPVSRHLAPPGRARIISQFAPAVRSAVRGSAASPPSAR